MRVFQSIDGDLTDAVSEQVRLMQPLLQVTGSPF